MANKDNEKSDDKPCSTENPSDVCPGRSARGYEPMIAQDSRRRGSPPFLIRSAVGGAAAVMTGRYLSAEERTAMAIATLPPQAKPATPPQGKPATPPLAADLNVVKKGAGPVLTTVDEFYKVGPGPSSSHTIGPMRITYDFYQQAAELPADKLAKATKLQVNLFGSLARRARATARNARRSPGWSGKNRPRSTRNFSTACATSPTRCSR